MSRILIAACILLLTVKTSFAQTKSGFDRNRAREMVRICNSFSSIDLFNSDEDILPKGYEKIYTSGSYGMDNKFQIYRSGKIGVIHFRGSTAERISWLENINSAMIPAEGRMKVNGKPFPYSFAKDTNAAVHTGYALGMGFLHEDILFHIKDLNRRGIHDIIITGHSQGGALANLCMAYLKNLSSEELSSKNRFKTYAFAAPMVGNDAFAAEYKERYCDEGMSYNLVNPKDPVPKLPHSYHENSEEFFSEHLDKALNDEKEFRVGEAAKEGAALLFEEEMKKMVDRVGQKTNEQIEKELGPFEIPKKVEDIDYHPICNRKELKPVEYPKILKDSSIVTNDSIADEYERGPDGHFKNDRLYKDPPFGFQHKSYNYYISYLKTYYPERYKKTPSWHERMREKGELE